MTTSEVFGILGVLFLLSGLLSCVVMYTATGYDDFISSKTANRPLKVLISVIFFFFTGFVVGVGFGENLRKVGSLFVIDVSEDLYSQISELVGAIAAVAVTSSLSFLHSKRTDKKTK